MELTRQKELERSIVKKYRKEIWTKFTKAINEYDLINDGDCIGVAMSGGKASFLLAKLFQEILRHGQKHFELSFFVLSEENSEVNEMIATGKDIGIDIKQFSSYQEVEALSCNKIALGHHFDDVIESILLGLLYEGKVETIMPKEESSLFSNVQWIRPLYLIKKEDITHFSNYNEIKALSVKSSLFEKEHISNSDERQKVRALIKKLRSQSPYIEMNIFRSVENVNLSTIIAYEKEGKKHHFLDQYE